MEVRKKTGAPPHSARCRPAKACQGHKQAVPQIGALTLVHPLAKKLAVYNENAKSSVNFNIKLFGWHSASFITHYILCSDRKARKKAKKTNNFYIKTFARIYYAHKLTPKQK
ncbi:MAG TPA: hypothetical protein HPP87_07915 [Planctomycetes bacterium]|nr:hypothetical protein [Planctomycetota bacterium]